MITALSLRIIFHIVGLIIIIVDKRIVPIIVIAVEVVMSIIFVLIFVKEIL
jgi:hypothetical protein